MKKLILSLLLFPLVLYGATTNKVDNLWVPSTGSVRFSNGTPGSGKFWTSDSIGLGSWTTMAPTGAVTDARYLIKAGFSSGPQLTDGKLTLTNGATLLVTGPGTQIWTNQFGNSFSTNKLFLISENMSLNAALDMLVFLDTTDTRQGSIGLRTAQGNVGNGLYLSGGDVSSGNLGVGNAQLQLSAVGAGWSLTQGGGNATTVTTGYGEPVAVSGGAAGATNLTVAKLAIFNGGLISSSTNTLTGIRYPLTDGATNTVLTTYGNGTTAFLPIPASGGGLTNIAFSQRSVLFGSSAQINSMTNDNVLGYSSLQKCFDAWTNGGPATSLYNGNSVSTNIGTIYVMAGIHYFPTNIVITNPIRLRGDGKFASSLHLQSNSACGFMFSNALIFVEDIGLYEDNHATTGQGFIDGKGPAFTGWVKDCYLKGGGGSAGNLVKFTQANAGMWKDNIIQIDGTSAIGFYFNGGSTGATNGYFEGNTITGTADRAIYNNGGADYYFRNNTFVLSGSSAAVEQPSGYAWWFGNYIRNTHSTGPGIIIGATATPLVDNNVFNCVGLGISGFGLGRIRNNHVTCSGANQDATKASGTAAGGAIVEGNTFIGTGTGLAIQATASNQCFWVNNKLRKPTGDVAGSSTSTNLYQQANFNTWPTNGAGGVVINYELPAATTY